MKKTVNKLVPSVGQNSQGKQGHVLGRIWGELTVQQEAVECVQMRSVRITLAPFGVLPSSLGSFSRTT